jgi:hypothetical protein
VGITTMTLVTIELPPVPVTVTVPHCTLFAPLVPTLFLHKCA